MAKVHCVHWVIHAAYVAHVVHVVHAADAQVHIVVETGLIGHLVAKEGVLRIGVKTNIEITGSANVAAIVVHEMMSEGVGCLDLLNGLQSH